MTRLATGLKDLDDDHPPAATRARLAGRIRFAVGGATAIPGTVGNAHAFKNGRQFAASLGLVPGQRSSGGRTQLLGITKRGDSYLRKLLVQGARAIMRVVGRHDDRQSQWVRQLLTRRHKHVVAVALANKLAHTVWALLVKGEQFEMVR